MTRSHYLVRFRPGGRVLMAVLLAVCALLVVVAPRAVGTSWEDVGKALLTVKPIWWGPLAVVWLAGLWAYAAVMTACLPGLSARRAMGLNLAGSAVANSLPLGGAVSFALTTAMTRSWGFSPAAVTSFLLLTNVWNVLSRLLFGALAAIWFLKTGIGAVVGAPVLIIGACLVVAVLVAGLMLASDRATRWTARAVTALEESFRARFRPTARRRPEHQLAAILTTLRNQVGTTLRTSWPRLSLGMAGYIALLAVLLDMCLRGLGAPQSVMLILAAVGIERLVTALPITPGGAGVAELSLAACLIAGGVPGAQALAAALLYRIFTFFAEVPLGAVVTLVWHLHRKQVTLRSAFGVAGVGRAS
jgi:putative heme transporter